MSLEGIKALTIRGPLSGGRPAWTEIAHRLARAPSHVSDYARAKYALEDMGRWKFTRYLIDRYSEEELCRLAIAESMDHGKCRVCNGRMWVQIKNKRIVCGACDGTGDMRWDGELRRRLLDISKKEWKEREGKYEEIMLHIAEIEYVLWVAMVRE